jgi:dienelactone hydrolase
MSAVLSLAVLASCARSGGTPSSGSNAELVSRVIEYKHGDAVLEGYLVYKSGDEKRPGVLVCHEWKGHGPYVRLRAEELARLGYVAFALDIYGKGVVAKDHTEAAKLAGMYKGNRTLMRGRVKAGYDVLAGQSVCDAKKIAVMGYCFGGTCALELARSGVPVAGVATFHGDLSTPTPEDAKNIKGKVIAFHGADDPFVKPEVVLAFEDEMRKGGVDWQLVLFGGTVHSFTVREAGSDPSTGMAYNEKSDQRSWAMLEDFLDECFGR